ncbi:hypothetical protein I3F58_04615 [Streptomyces sp. MUM 203J]|uniref:hypothetical protein n=1 Tax=Streptomyces sp. MUM 203J TaxID=2791990 RepID=UPI001F0387CB|nr:hypothetical protein [Streptomyces sp. MUM 203J]MCH0538851.1 hypothetical protein [Streptomyces sp. MUM 203J]
MNLRMIGLGAVVTAAALLPFVATAGTVASPEQPNRAAAGPEAAAHRPAAPPLLTPLSDPAPGASTHPEAQSGAEPPAPGPDPGRDEGPVSGTRAVRPSGAPDDDPALDLPLLAESDGPPTAPSDGSADAPDGRAAHCGPALASPEGVEAQTCVLTEGGQTWGRTYYRNTSGRELRAILSLMGPAGRTVRTHCAIPARDEPGACETPRENGQGPAEEYTAVAEFATNGHPDSPLLLRSGSNPGPSSRR